MAIQYVYNTPGVQSDRTTVYRRVMKSANYELWPGGGVIDGTTSRDPGNNTGTDDDKLRAGLLMGLGTNDQWSPSILGVTSNAEAAASTAIEVDAGVGDELVRRIGSTGSFNLTGPPTAGGIVVTESVTYSAEAAGVITVTAISDAFVAGSFVQPTDGTQTPLSLIPDDFPNKVTDANGTNIDVNWPNIPIGGVIDASQILPAWPSDVSLRSWIMNRLNGGHGSRFFFDHVFAGEAN